LSKLLEIRVIIFVYVIYIDFLW